MEPLKNSLDISAVWLVIATLVDWLPAAAALLSIIWTTLRIIEILCNWGWVKRKK